MGCTFDFSDNNVKAVYLFDENEMGKINRFKDEYIEWLQNPKKEKAPALLSEKSKVHPMGCNSFFELRP